MRRAQFRFHPRLLLLALAVLVAAGTAGAAEVKQEIDRTFPLQAGGELVLQNVNGNVTVETWDRDEVHLKVVKKVKASSREKAQEGMERFEIAIDSNPDRLRVEARKPRSEDGGWFGWMRGDNVQYQASFHLTVPRRADLDAETVNGGVEVSDLEGRIEVGTVNGRVALRGVAGSADVSTTNGRIEVTDARGRVSASTTNGGIEVALAAVEPGADMRFSTTNGGVEVRLPRDVRTHLKARTTNGGISTDFPVEVRGRVSKSIDGELNGGGDGQIEIRTTNGGIRIHEG